MQVLIPMAGEGKRFKEAGYTFPKPLIEIHSEPMIEWVINNLGYHRSYIFLIRQEHEDKYNISEMLRRLTHDPIIINMDSLTEGAACTTLLAKKFINHKEPLIIANSDQYVQWYEGGGFDTWIRKSNDRDLDGSILTFNSVHPKWSYVKVNDDKRVCEVAEKKPISDRATVGIYYWKYGSDYVKYAEQMIAKNHRVNGEFYVCPVFNEAIAEGKKIGVYPVRRMWGLGTPEDLRYFNDNWR